MYNRDLSVNAVSSVGFVQNFTALYSSHRFCWCCRMEKGCWV